ncbi:unnamed protein product [Vitrella brassicaformis CCMP3155]|uniref:Uncharacterized protein n=2 Tax=Vitrella brassicaformis TaxID=1169539 RepID=A0A0G4G706_VITBC|nr:unnamed protein product [Vitrella brassicaformis CCMP3155]|mmetsp:Transcript_5097/g.13944  ORF Transcript_5097/g.13944 Transcript_5097/m.13944 type:complete len:109 (+) Transcript_5097:103-429(+)|eukprot:CEM24400.1 unnamed protein product [Vitrella brassicaformis CCMP3155]
MTTPTPFGFKIAGRTVGNVDALTADNPHATDPRFFNPEVTDECFMRYQIWARCCRELGDDHVRCRYQYFRAQCCCVDEQLTEFNEYREMGSCQLDWMPDRSTIHMRGD